MGEFMMSVKDGEVEVWKDGEQVELSPAAKEGLIELSARQEALAVESEKLNQKQRELMQGRTDDDLEIFDWSLYSALVRKTRKDMGYKTAEAFARTIYRRTRLKVSKDSIYKIEQGKQVPDALQFMAINLSLYGEPFPSKIVDSCLCPEWVEIIKNHGAISAEWKFENFEDARAELADQDEDDMSWFPGHVISMSGDKAELFSETPF